MAAPSEDHDQKPITMVRPLHSARGSTRPRCQIVRCLSPRPRTSTLGQSLPSPLPSWRQRRSPTHLPPPAALRSPPTSPPQSSPPTRQSNTVKARRSVWGLKRHPREQCEQPPKGTTRTPHWPVPRPRQWLRTVSIKKIRVPAYIEDNMDFFEEMRKTLRPTRLYQRRHVVDALHTLQVSHAQRVSNKQILLRGVVVREESDQERGSATVLLPPHSAPPVVYVKREIGSGGWQSRSRPDGLLQELSNVRRERDQEDPPSSLSRALMSRTGDSHSSPCRSLTSRTGYSPYTASRALISRTENSASCTPRVMILRTGDSISSPSRAFTSNTEDSPYSLSTMTGNSPSFPPTMLI